MNLQSEDLNDSGSIMNRHWTIFRAEDTGEFGLEVGKFHGLEKPLLPVQVALLRVWAPHSQISPGVSRRIRNRIGRDTTSACGKRGFFHYGRTRPAARAVRQDLDQSDSWRGRALMPALIEGHVLQ